MRKSFFFTLAIMIVSGLGHAQTNCSTTTVILVDPPQQNNSVQFFANAEQKVLEAQSPTVEECESIRSHFEKILEVKARSSRIEEENISTLSRIGTRQTQDCRGSIIKKVPTCHVDVALTGDVVLAVTNTASLFKGRHAATECEKVRQELLISDGPIFHATCRNISSRLRKKYKLETVTLKNRF